jgi:hypothetical protein
MKNISDEGCRENKNTNLKFNNFFFSKVCEITWKNSVEPGRTQKYGLCTLHAAYLRLQKHTQNMYVIIIAFPLQQCLHEQTSMLPNAPIPCLVSFSIRVSLSISVCLIETVVGIIRGISSMWRDIVSKYSVNLYRKVVTMCTTFISWKDPYLVLSAVFSYLCVFCEVETEIWNIYAVHLRLQKWRCKQIKLVTNPTSYMNWSIPGFL